MITENLFYFILPTYLDFLAYLISMTSEGQLAPGHHHLYRNLSSLSSCQLVFVFQFTYPTAIKNILLYFIWLFCVLVKGLYKQIMWFIPLVPGNIFSILLNAMCLAATINGLELLFLASVIFYVSSPLTRGNSKTELWTKDRCGFYEMEKKERLLFLWW